MVPRDTGCHGQSPETINESQKGLLQQIAIAYKWRRRVLDRSDSGDSSIRHCELILEMEAYRAFQLITERHKTADSDL